MKLTYYGPLTNFAFKFNLRRYTLAAMIAVLNAKIAECEEQIKVGWCTLALVNPC